jgi:hypothetical protein
LFYEVFCLPKNNCIFSFKTVFCFGINWINLLRFFSPYVLVPRLFLSVYSLPIPVLPESVFVFFLVIFTVLHDLFSILSLSSHHFLASTISCHFRALSCYVRSYLIPILSCPSLVIVLYLVPVLTSILFLSLALPLSFSCIWFSWNNFLFRYLYYF